MGVFSVDKASLSYLKSFINQAGAEVLNVTLSINKCCVHFITKDCLLNIKYLVLKICICKWYDFF